MAMVLDFEKDLISVSQIADVFSRKRVLDELEEETARRVARRVGDQEVSGFSTDKKKKRRRDFAENLREMTQKAKIPKFSTRLTTISIARGSSSQQEVMQHDDDQEQVTQHVQEVVGHWFHDMEGNILYLDPKQ